MATVGLGDVAGQSFDLYEGIRIVIPAAILIGFVEAVGETINPERDFGIVSSPLVAIALVLAVGIVLRLVDLPSVAAAYRQEQPESLLREWAKSLGISPRVVKRHMFYLVDVEIPANLRSRALYMGSLFRVGFETIVFAAFAQIVIWNYSAYGPRNENGNKWVFSVGLASLTSVVLWRALASYTRVSRSSEPETSFLNKAIRVVSETAADLSRTGIVLTVLLTALAAWAPLFDSNESRVVITATALLMGHWFVRFTWGRTIFGGSPTAIGPLTSSLLYIIPTSITIYFAGYSEERVALSETEAIAWMVVSVAAALLIANRGHEKVIRGSYFEQRHWMHLNEQKIRLGLNDMVGLD